VFATRHLMELEVGRWRGGAWVKDPEWLAQRLPRPRLADTGGDGRAAHSQAQDRLLYQPSERLTPIDCALRFVLNHFSSFKLIREMAMSVEIVVQEDFDAAGLRFLAGKTKDASQARRHLAIAAVCEGMDRDTAARIGGMDPGSSPGPDIARLGAPLQRGGL
jgi:hypothetical protein